jgi:hypothetical protein
MSSEQPKREGPLHEAGYEREDAAIGPTLRAGVYLLGAMFLVSLVVVPLYWFYARRETAAQPERATVLTASPPPGAFPRLVESEPRALAEFRAREDVLLGSYGWIDRDRGLARMPIEEAVRIVGERGALPAFSAAPPPDVPVPASGAPSPSGGAPSPAGGAPSASRGTPSRSEATP